MSLVEGVGDEVIEFLIGILFVTIGVVAWWSTRTVDRPIIRTVVVFERRAQNQTNNAAEELRAEPTSQRDYVEELTPAPPAGLSTPDARNKPPAAGTSDDPPISSPSRPITDEESAIVEAMDSETSVLRRRRLDFFESRQEQAPTAHESTVMASNAREQADCADTDAPHAVGRSDEHAHRTEHVSADDITIKLKYINDDLRLVNGRLQEPLGDFKRRHFEGELANDKLVRLIFNGQVLQRDDLTLEGCGMFDNCVVHCLVHQKRQSSAAGGPGAAAAAGGPEAGATLGGARVRRSRSAPHPQINREWDLGNLFFAIVSFMLGAAWYFRYEYAQLYTVTATVALVGLTGIFTVLLVGMYFPDPDPPAAPMRP